jgi:hypothetical protein
VTTSAPTIGYRDRTDHPWPRILQFIGIVTLVYAAGLIGQTIYSARMLWPIRRTPPISASASMYVFWFIASAVEIAIGVVVIIGAIALLHRGKQRLILVGQWALIIFWIIAFFVGTVLRSNTDTFSILFSSVIYGVQFNIFPFTVILLLRAARSM